MLYQSAARPPNRIAGLGLFMVLGIVLPISVQFGCSSPPGELKVTADKTDLNALVGKEATSVVTLTNDGGTDLLFAYVYEETPSIAQGRQFTITNHSAEQIALSPGESTTITVSFTPLQVGSSQIDLRFDTPAPKTLTLHGTGQNNAPEVMFTAETPAKVCLGLPATLSASIHDVEDAATLASLKSTLTSDQEGTITGGRITAAGDYSVIVVLEEAGPQSLVLEVTDSLGATGEDTLALLVDDTDDNGDGTPDCADQDQDGYTPEGGDCNDRDASIYPGAADICSGVDEDCDGEVDSLQECDLDHDGTSDWTDDDGDGQTEREGDCDDGDNTVYAGATELCDGKDNDCDQSIDEAFDADGDGFASAACPDGLDCDDSNAEVHPGAVEVCEAEGALPADNNCDGQIDEGLDDDSDGYNHCSSGPGSGDCNDADLSVHPGATELCDSIDQNCDGVLDEAFDVDGDGYTTCAAVPDCNDADAAIHPGASETCNGQDDDCDGQLDEDPALDNDQDGYTACGSSSIGPDCKDDNAAVHPGATEVCNDVDDNCDGVTDEGFDADQDGYRDQSCPGGDDCNDHSAAINPGITEVCNGIDDNCNGTADDGFDVDRDGFYSSTGCPNGKDCDDSNGSINPNAIEVCDGQDNDCNGETDETDIDGDGFSPCVTGGEVALDCNDFNAHVYPNAVEGCNLIDDDCDGKMDEDFDGDGDGYSTCEGDCADDDPTLYPTIVDSGWIEYLCNPVLPVTPGSGNDSIFADQAAVLRDPDAGDDERYKMWYRFGDSANTQRIGYAVSADGIDWTKKGPVLVQGPAGEFDDLRLNFPSVLYLDGQYHMWYHAFSDANPDPNVVQPSPARIGYATSVDGTHWTRVDGDPSTPIVDPVLLPAEGAWDSFSVQAPSVIWMADRQQFYMWYAANSSSSGALDIGLATSEDGVTWTRVDGDPNTPAMDPVLARGLGFDSTRVSFPRVVYNGMFFEMTYSGSSLGSTAFQIGYASSDDGVEWLKYDEAVQRNGGAEWKSATVYSGEVLFNYDLEERAVYSMYFSGSNSVAPVINQTGMATNIQPAVQLIAPADRSSFTVDDTVLFQAYVDEPFFVDTVFVRLETDLGDTLLGARTVDANGYVTFKTKLPAGVNTIMITAQDRGGLESFDLITLNVQE